MAFQLSIQPSAGGCWERSVKRVLKQSLKELEWKPFVVTANIINSRPLTHVPVSSEEEDPLTPKSFLLGVPNAIQSPGPLDEKLWTFRKQWRVLASMGQRVHAYIDKTDQKV